MARGARAAGAPRRELSRALPGACAQRSCAVSAREDVLARVRAAVTHAVPAPEVFEASRRRADFAAFSAQLAAAGGEGIGPLPQAELRARVADLCGRLAPGERVLASDAALLRLGSGPWRPIPSDSTPHALADVAVAILCGSLAVAENGAVGLDGREARPRALPVICDQLVLLVEIRQIVPDMHAALAQLPEGALAQHHFTFVAGPSKTADIEGELVLGAHGPRGLTVIGVDV
jgi:L-lactate dehydrogenase complex protein LldG